LELARADIIPAGERGTYRQLKDACALISRITAIIIIINIIAYPFAQVINSCAVCAGTPRALVVARASGTLARS
jgi:hypothetical protein